jgi:nicotinate-nucleotide pyrophosphorylase (carboxylating)
VIEQYKLSIKQDVNRALVEDLCLTPQTNGQLIDASNDITAMLIDAETVAEAKIITREDIVLCGQAWASEAFKQIDPSIALTWQVNDGDAVDANSTLLVIKGKARAILSAERTALNFLQMLSGTATTTAYYVKCLQGSRTRLLDTRKTIPGFRQAQKYAVACGGGKNHRIGLYDAYLIKENHIKACGSITNAIIQAKHLQSEKPVEIEVENLEELTQAIAAGADIIMLDNFSTKLVYEAVTLNNEQCKLEVSGNITLERLAELAKTGVDYISSGAITKHVKAVDLSLLIL